MFEGMEELKPGGWSPDGAILFFDVDSVNHGLDLWTVTPALAGSARSVLRTPFNEAQPAISPDGRWLAYSSDENGRNEVYVRSWPDLDRKWQVSTEGGSVPRWNSNGGEIFFLDAGALYAVEFDADSNHASHGCTAAPLSGSLLQSIEAFLRPVSGRQALRHPRQHRPDAR